MCGIVGYLGEDKAVPFLIKGLKALEYRGYDSAGIAVIEGDKIFVKKQAGKIEALAESLADVELTAALGIGHTRWATHGDPSTINAHPHLDCRQVLALVHNGIIENYQELKEALRKEGHQFASSTDSEVLVHLIEKFYHDDLQAAVLKALRLVEGAYGIAVISAREPDKIVAARQGSPLVLGIGFKEMIIASDTTPILPHTNNVVYLRDREVAVIKKREYDIITLDEQTVVPEVQQVNESLESIAKSGFKHFMLKEIFWQPRSLSDTMRGRLLVDKQEVKLGGIEEYLGKILSARRFILTGCGTSWHACLVGEYLLEELAGIPVEVEYASEFRYRSSPIDKQTVCFAVSQSGETADTLAALRRAKDQGAFTLGICNVVGSTIARETDAGVYLHAGPEIGVASTKAFTSQVLVFVLLALLLAQRRGRKLPDDIFSALAKIPEQVDAILAEAVVVEKLARKFKDSGNFLYLGRGYNFPVALEGALKLKEISYIHAEGYPAAEMKHGPIALIDQDMPVLFLAPQDEIYTKVVSNIEEVRARGGRVIAIATQGDDKIRQLSEEVIYIPPTLPQLSPLLTVIPLQLLAYYIADFKGLDVDKPRNLAKSVTVE